MVKFNCKAHGKDFLKIILEGNLLYLKVKQGDEMSLVMLDKKDVKDLIDVLVQLHNKM